MNDYGFVAGPTRDVLADGIDDGRGKEKGREKEVVNALWTEKKKKVGGNEGRSVKGG